MLSTMTYLKIKLPVLEKIINVTLSSLILIIIHKKLPTKPTRSRHYEIHFIILLS